MSPVRYLLPIVLAAACTQPPAPQPRAQTVATLVFRDVTVFDGDGSVGVVDLAVDEDRIVLIGPDLVVTSSAEVIDGTGKTLLPALIDVGAHVAMIDPAKLAEGIAQAGVDGKRAVVPATKLADARAAIEAGAQGLSGVVADAPLDDAFLTLAAQRSVFVIATLPAGDTIAPEVVNNVVALRGRVTVLAGPGADQLARLVAVGFLPEEAIASATVVPARLFGLDDRGRIAEGMRADLLLVEGNPLEDITALRKVAGQWVGGVALSAGTP